MQKSNSIMFGAGPITVAFPNWLATFTIIICWCAVPGCCQPASHKRFCCLRWAHCIGCLGQQLPHGRACLEQSVSLSHGRQRPR